MIISYWSVMLRDRQRYNNSVISQLIIQTNLYLLNIVWIHQSSIFQVLGWAQINHITDKKSHRWAVYDVCLWFSQPYFLRIQNYSAYNVNDLRTPFTRLIHHSWHVFTASAGVLNAVSAVRCRLDNRGSIYWDMRSYQRPELKTESGRHAECVRERNLVKYQVMGSKSCKWRDRIDGQRSAGGLWTVTDRWASCWAMCLWWEGSWAAGGARRDWLLFSNLGCFAFFSRPKSSREFHIAGRTTDARQQPERGRLERDRRPEQDI